MGYEPEGVRNRGQAELRWMGGWMGGGVRNRANLELKDKGRSLGLGSLKKSWDTNRAIVRKRMMMIMI